jgi:hypothetical protein
MAESQIRRALQNAAQERSGLWERREVGAVDFSRTTPTQLPEVLRDAAKRALGYATDLLNQLDHNPFISDEWAIVAAELESLAMTLERRLCALFDGKDRRYGSTQGARLNPLHQRRMGDRRQGVVVTLDYAEAPLLPTL